MSEFPFFLKLNNGPLYVYTIFCLSINVSMGCFPLLNMSSNELFHMSTSVQMSVQIPASDSFEYIPRNGLPGSYDTFIFNYLRNHRIVFHGDCTILHSYWQHTRVPVSALPRQCLSFSVSCLFGNSPPESYF